MSSLRKIDGGKVRRSPVRHWLTSRVVFAIRGGERNGMASRLKDQFPADWQEHVQHAETGERHIADVKTSRGWVIEFQHSYLKPEERRFSRSVLIQS